MPADWKAVLAELAAKKPPNPEAEARLRRLMAAAKEADAAPKEAA